MTPKILILDRSEDLAEQVRAVADDLEHPPEVVSCTRVGSAGHVLEHDGPFSMILAGPSLATKAGLKRLAGLHRELPGSAFIICFEHRPDASLREIVQVGAIDLLEMPVDDAALRQSIRRGLEMADSRPRPHVSVVGPEGPPPAPAREARVFTVCSATGGCGKTFYATNMAMFLAENTNARVALVDLDLQFGEITTALRLQPSFTIVDAVQGGADDEAPADLSTHIEDYMIQYNGSFWTLAAPREPSQADEITPVDATRVIEALRNQFDYVVVDTPTALAETVLAAFDLSEHLFAMATLDLPSVRNLGVFLQTLEKLQIPTGNISLILNKVERDIGIDVAQIVKMFPQGFRAQLPYAKEVARSINMGRPVVASYPDVPVSFRLAEGLAEFLPEADRDRFHAANQARAQARGGVFSRFLRRKTPVVQGGER